MLISILVANFNNGNFFNDCFQSIHTQTYSNWEVIIVDDCSSDNSTETIEQIIGSDSRFKLYKNEKNCGVGFTKNKCVEMATGELCAFVDPDDMIEPNALVILLNTFTQNKNTVLAHSSFKMFDEKMKQTGEHLRAKQVKNGDPYFFNFDGEITHFAMFSRKAYLNTAGIDSYMRRAVDQDLYLKLYEQGDVVFVNEFLYKYRVHEKGISTGIAQNGAQKAVYWHWYACNNAAKRRGVIIEDLFIKQFVLRAYYERIENKLAEITNSKLYSLARKAIHALKLKRS